MDYKLAMRLTLTLFLFHANLLLAENIAAVAARTRSWFLQAWRVLGPHNVSVNEDLREAAKQVEVLASVQTYVLVFVTMYGRINHSHSIEFHPELLEQFAIGGKEADALEKSKISSSGGSSLHQYRDYQIF
uniref:Uncharacterized protein n=1 Tax=Brassica campestris TaxID=3711 RepID=A0A3P5YMF3_BRACM|nr:unnamed protein product [Brassica rapa]